MEHDPKIVRAQLRLAAELWTGVQREAIPADRFLSRYFFQNRKKIGSRDRRFLSETIFSGCRHKSYLEAWLETDDVVASWANEEEKREIFCVLAAAKEGLI